MPPKVLARNADRTGGVLPVNAAARANANKPPATKLKLEIRRLPPGLTLFEFEETLGEEWRLGNGKVDWREYRQGKTRVAGSGKVPEQSRCYIHVASESCVQEFEKRFLEVVFHDKAGTHKNPELKNLQPTLGFAPNQRTPLQQTKRRADNRQGTIDQDPDFMAFLEGETQPIVKANVLDGQEKESEKTEVKTTPLIEDLREKKANKAKAAQAKAEKAEKDKKDKAAKSKEKEKDAEKESGSKSSQQKVEQAAKDAAKVLTKQAAGKQKEHQAPQPKTASPAKARKPQPSPKPQSATPATLATPSGPNSPASRRQPAERQRGSTEGIKKMLQKDLGIKPKANAPAGESSVASASASTSPTSTSTTSAASKTTVPKSTTTSSATPNQPSEANIAFSSSAKAYLKHANPSQGMTEILIQNALSQYGEMSSVTIDPRKGTAVAVFKDNEGLKKALEAKRVPVAEGSVEVHTFRAGGLPNRGGFRGGRGGRGGARGSGSQSAGGQSTTIAANTGAPAPTATPEP